jgi:hypothetical protein
MAHDNQIKRSSDENEGNKSARKSLEVVADWWTLSLQVWRDDPTEELALIFRETLKDFKPEILHKAFIRVMKTCKFRPSPAEVIEAANIEMELAASPRTSFPKISQEEREAALAETTESREKLRKSLHEKQMSPSPLAELFATAREIFTPEQWAATEKAYKEYLTIEGNKDAYNRANGISPIPRAREEQLAIYYNLPKNEREKIRKQVRQ